VTSATLAVRRPTLFERPLLAVGLLLMGAMATTVAAVGGNGNLVIAMAPIALAVGTYAFWVLPIRYTMFVVIFLSLTLDAIEEGPWSSPLAPLGSLLANNLNKSLPISALTFPGVAVVMLAMVGLLVHRSFVGSQTDSHGRTPTPLPLIAALAVSFVTVLALCAIGVARGGDMQMAKIQVQSYLLLLMMAYLAAMSLRGTSDYRILGRIIVAAAVARSFYVFYVVHHLSHQLEEGGTIAVAATHGDSLVFSAAAVLLVVEFLEQPSRRAALWCLALVPILLVAMNQNNRRLVWVQLAAGLLTFAMLSRRSRIKRLLANALLLSLPLIVVYVAAGWNSQSKVFAPIKMYRSVTDGTVDNSTLYRDLENYNLIMTMRLHPLTGVGFGQPFVEVVALPSIAGVFREYRYMPHNAILGLWAYTGPLGFTGLFLPLVVAMYFAIRSYGLAGSAAERTAAVMVVAMVVIYFMHCWGDVGFAERRAIFLVGPALAIAGQLAHKTGAFWPRSTRHA
jgi:O-Antigen ligase